jgi:murein DD-endopeptidase MepM/ murein hydrolase activator NlpD
VLAEIEAAPRLETLTPATAAAAQARPEPATGDEAVATPAPAVFDRASARAAAPLDAPTLAGFRPLAGTNGARSTSPANSSAATGPWSVSLSAQPGVGSLAADLKKSLQQIGIEVRDDDAPGPADAAILLAPGLTSAWYCDAPDSGSATLAAAVSRELPAVEGASPPGFDCAGLQAAGARVPSVLVLTSAPADTATAAKLASVVADYFRRHGPAQRRAQAAAGLRWPALGAITSDYGPGHPLGIDIGQSEGPIRAASDGVVSFAGGMPCCSYGRFVVIDGPGGIRTLYAHLDSLSVKTGDRVKAGQALGEVGCSGTCSGPHLHFEVFDGGVRRNPLLYLP